MRLALIPPISLLEETDRTNMQMALPHMLEESETYRYVYEKHCGDPSQFVILDNGAAEGVVRTGEQILDLALRTGVDEMVIPDVIRDAAETLALGQHFIKNIYLDEFDLRYMYVIQGVNFEQFVVQAQWANEQDVIDTIGVPRHMIETCGSEDARARLVQAMYDRGCKKKMHLLGAAATHPTEMKDHAWRYTVRSTDTSSPFNFAYADTNLRRGYKCKRPAGYFQLHMEAFNLEVMENNITKLIDWTK